MFHLRGHTRRVLGVAVALVLGAMFIAGMTVVLYPATDDIPEPSLDYNLGGLFRYVNGSLGGSTTNMGEFHFSFDNMASGSAFLRLRSVVVTVWVRDITSDQPDTALIRVDDMLTGLVLNPGRHNDRLSVESATAVEGGWWATGICRAHASGNGFLTDMSLHIDYVFRLSNELASERDGHQFLVKTQLNVTYDALYFGGLFSMPYRTAVYDWIFGDEWTIDMLPFDSP